MERIKIDIIGTGNVASHLTNALKDKADVSTVNSRTLEGLRKDSDVYLISVSDDAISNVASKIADNVHGSSVIAHTSGSTPLSILDSVHAHVGVFYPLQTFTKGFSLNYEEIPFFLEGSDNYTDNIIESAAKLISERVRFINSSQRKKLHIASVLSCNFVNHLWCLADNYLKDHGLMFSDLVPLVKETTSKISRVNPYDAQTGPAVRRDQKTIDSHMDQLDSYPELKHIYSVLTDSIMETHKDNAGPSNCSRSQDKPNLS